MQADDLLAACLLAALLVLAITVLTMRGDGRFLRERAAREETARRQWSRALADASFDGLLVHRQGVILQINRPLARLLGAREREWLGQHFTNFARPDQASALRAELEAPQPQLAEFHLLRSNKTEVAVEISSHNIDYEGQPATVTAIRDISQRIADAQRISRLTYYDPLTGLPNRKLFNDTLVAALARLGRQSGTVTLFMIDLDHFKHSNAQLGRNGGDALLKQAAQRIAAMASRDDLPARLGGDKFALMLLHNGPTNQGLSLAQRLCAAFNEPFVIEGQMVRLRLCIGIAVYPDHAGDADSLLQAADFALEQAERKGGGSVHMFAHHEAMRAEPVAAK